MAYRVTFLTNKYIPVELLMSQQLNSTLQLTPLSLNPDWTDITKLRKNTTEEKRQKRSWNFNKRHRAVSQN